MTRSPTLFELARRAARVERPGEALGALTALRSRLDALEAVHVENALDAGWSWSRIAAALGVTKQAAHKKHARRVRRTLPDGDLPETMTLEGRARLAVFFARHEARALGHGKLEPPHLLLGLLHSEGGAAADALASLGLTLQAARERVKQELGERDATGSSPGDRITVSPRARRVLEQSLHEAVRLGHGHLGLEHLLLAVLRDEAGGTARVLSAFGVEREAVEERLVRTLAKPR